MPIHSAEDSVLLYQPCVLGDGAGSNCSRKAAGNDRCLKRVCQGVSELISK